MLDSIRPVTAKGAPLSGTCAKAWPATRRHRRAPWRGTVVLAVVSLLVSAPGLAQNRQNLRLTDTDFVLTNTFSDVSDFSIEVLIDAPVTPGRYVDPPIELIAYRVQGTLAADTPSGFEAFELVRELSGEEFYAQGGTLTFEISESAVLDDAVQVAELAGDDVVLTFDAREVDTGRFHPPRLTLRADGTGRLQNSDNVPDGTPIDAGSEYVTDLAFDPGNTTVIGILVDLPEVTPDPDGGGGAVSPLALLLMVGWLVMESARRRRLGSHTPPAPPQR